MYFDENPFMDFPVMENYQAAEFMKIFMVVYFAAILLVYIYTIAAYVLHAYGLYTMAMRRGIKRPWLAWLPIGTSWILGNIADQYRYVARGEIKNRRKLILGLTIGIVVLFLAIYGTVLASFLTFFDMVLAGYGDEKKLLMVFGILMLCYVGMAVLALIQLVTEYVCYYDLFNSCTPNHSVTLIVLSIFFSFLLPFFVFALRNKDGGMPPRKQVPAQPQIAPQPVVQPAPEAPAFEETISEPEE